MRAACPLEVRGGSLEARCVIIRTVFPPQPMRLVRVRQPFDHPEFIYEIKIDGFRGVAVVDGGGCELISRNGHGFNQWDSLKREIALAGQLEEPHARLVNVIDVAHAALDLRYDVEQAALAPEQR